MILLRKSRRLRLCKGLGRDVAFHVALPIGGHTTIDRDATYAQKLNVSAHAEQDISLSVIALDLGMMAYW
jgi:hypothetical protein